MRRRDLREVSQADIWWHGAPGQRSSKWQVPGAVSCVQEQQAGPTEVQCPVLVASGVVKISVCITSSCAVELMAEMGEG